MLSLTLSNGVFVNTVLIRIAGLGKDGQKRRQRTNFLKKSYTICTLYIILLKWLNHEG